MNILKRSLLGVAFLSLGAISAVAQTVTLTWTNPVSYAGDGPMPLGAIASVDIWDVTTQNPTPTKVGTVTGPVTANSTFTTGQLTVGFHNFTVTVNTTAGGVSAMSNTFSVQIMAPAPVAVTNLSGTVGP